MDNLRKLNPTSLLEVGCGYGKFMRYVANTFDCFPIGIDFSSSQLQKAKIYLDAIGTLVQGDATRLPFKDDSFDVVYTWGVMTHILSHQIQETRKELIRVTKLYIVHIEDLRTNYFIKYGYDNAYAYQEIGISLINSRVYTNLGRNGTRHQFVIVEKSNFNEE